MVMQYFLRIVVDLQTEIFQLESDSAIREVSQDNLSVENCVVTASFSWSV